MTGKEKCEFLKNIRKKIADQNGIEYHPQECRNEGECPGFCPYCDTDADMLFTKLKLKEQQGEKVQIDTDILIELDRISQNFKDDHADTIEWGTWKSKGFISSDDESKIANTDPPIEKFWVDPSDYDENNISMINTQGFI